MYDRELKDRTITLQVSGMLWNRSLVMLDVETKSKWSHLLGKCMDGELKGTRLEIILSEIMTWDEWKREYPDSTVMEMSRSSRFNLEEMKRTAYRFVYGFEIDGRVGHVPLSTILEWEAFAFGFEDQSLVVVWDDQAGTARMFRATDADGNVVKLAVSRAGVISAPEVDMKWNGKTGVVISGTRDDVTLSQENLILSYLKAWDTFHPKSQDVSQR